MIEKVETPPSYVVVGHGFVQQGRSVWRGTHCARYRTCLISVNHELPDAIAFANGLSVNKLGLIVKAGVDVRIQKTRALRTMMRRTRSSQSLTRREEKVQRKSKNKVIKK